MDELQKLELEEFLEKLKVFKGRHTEMVSVLIPADYNTNLVAKQLEEEKGTATNIKSTATRKNVVDALERVVRLLKTLPIKFKNGLAVYCGNVSQNESQDDVQIFYIEPPQPLKVRLYRCDKDFVLEPLEEMLDVDEVYGLLTIDRNEATIGVLEGKRVKKLDHMTSGVPSKVRAGGQCLHPDTLIMTDDGDIIKIKDSHNPLLVQSENFNSETSEKTPVIVKWENKKQLFKIVTCYPKVEIKSSGQHTFFVRTINGIEEKMLSEINVGDYLVMPEKININNEDQKISFVPKVERLVNLKKVIVPEYIDSDFSRILGYYLGDGSHETDRITFFEQREEVAKYYQNLIRKSFGIDSDLRFRESKNYWQLRVYSRVLSQLFKELFNAEEKTLGGKIPSLVLRSSEKSLASFIGGFFDAEGYVSKGRIALGINNELLAKQLQFSLLRMGIISSISEYDNRRNPYSDKIRYTLSIDDLESLKKFDKLIGFCSVEKQNKSRELIDGRSNRNKVRQLVVNGTEVARIIRNSGLNTHDFHCGYFFCNKRQISKDVFKKRILDKIVDDSLRKRLELFYNSNLIAVKISKIEPVNLENTIDIETKNHNFIANGLVVHNSSQRFHRITEGLAKEFFRRVSERMKEIFFDMPKLKGILVGGPIPTKEEFLAEGQLVTKLKEKVIGVKDIGYVDTQGLKMLVEASQDVLAEQEITKEKKLLERFFNTLGKYHDMAAYKEDKVREALQFGAVKELFISKNFEKAKQKELVKLAEDIGSEIHFISDETVESDQFDNITGGVGAILRFQYHSDLHEK